MEKKIPSKQIEHAEKYGLTCEDRAKSIGKDKFGVALWKNDTEGFVVYFDGTERGFCDGLKDLIEKERMKNNEE